MTKRDKPRMFRNGNAGWLCIGELAVGTGQTMGEAYFRWLMQELEWEYIMAFPPLKSYPKAAPSLPRSTSSLSASEWAMIAGAAVGVALAMWTI